MKKVKDNFAVTGYVPNEVASRLTTRDKQLTEGTIDVKVERGFDEVMMRVNLADVTEVRSGASSKGETLVQLMLRDEFNVQTIIKTPASFQGISRLYDPTLQLLIASATAKKITPI